MMEHRWSMRKSANGAVVLNYPSLGLLRASIENISLGGVFVNTGRISLSVNTPVEMVFELPEGDARRVRKAEALVVRATDGGAGLMFHKFNPATFQLLQALLLEEAELLDAAENTADLEKERRAAERLQ